MLSIITAIYNLSDMNRLYYESLKKYTYYPFELIIIDNGSTDGSYEYFASKPEVTIIRNDGNYSYPYCQNVGIKHAKYDMYVFMNNDIVVSKHWDKHALSIMNEHHLDVATCVATDRVESEETTYLNRKRWKHIRIPLLTLFGARYWNLKLMQKLMYGNWDRFCEKRLNDFGTAICLGISGSNVFVTRRGIEKIGLWDERLQAADFDIFMRTRKRFFEFGDIQPAQLILGVYLHHYCRLTMKQKYPPFKDAATIISIEQKWDKTEAQRLIADSGLFL
jgi:GT2 family glycosyltransferase